MYDTLKEEFDGFVEESRKGNVGGKGNGSQSNINV